MATVELHQFVEQLSNFYTDAEAQLWLHMLHPMLPGARPIDLLNNGQEEAVLALIKRLEHGAFT
ncbi:hypothetical protein [Niveispirillum sp. KHB5.9]|uniref:hypothetical protein n=1 Tax=Niveispirillum sp. KHB5.9 TaxID=3400269 RepID=UPI003A84F805